MLHWKPIIIDGALMTQHPEQKPGEVLLCNCYRNEPEDMETITYQHIRAGQDAYDTDGNLAPSMYPVFVWQTEYDNRHKERTVEIGH